MFNIGAWVGLLVAVVLGISFIVIIIPESAGLVGVVNGTCGNPEGTVSINLGDSFRTDGYITTEGTCAKDTSNESVTLTAKGGGGSSSLTYFPSTLENNRWRGAMVPIVFLVPLLLILMFFGYILTQTEMGQSLTKAFGNYRRSRGGGGGF